MPIKTFVSGEILTASDTNAYLNNGGLVYITATTVSAASTPSIDSCFTSTYAHYFITYNLTSSLTGQYTAFRLRAGGVAKATNYNRFNFTATTAALSLDASGTAQTEIMLSGQSTTMIAGTMYVFNPQVSGVTGVQGNTVVPGSQYGFGGHQTETYQADGFQIFASGNAATYTGTIRVYGIRQA